MASVAKLLAVGAGLALIAAALAPRRRRPELLLPASVHRVPGLERVPERTLLAWLNDAERRRLDGDALATIVSLESGWNPRAENVTAGRAVGLLQWTASGASILGLSLDEILSAPLERQMEWVLDWFERVLRRRRPQRADDYYLVPLGRANLIGFPDEHVIFASDSREYRANPNLDTDSDGKISVGDIRAAFWRRRRGAKLVRLA